MSVIREQYLKRENLSMIKIDSYDRDNGINDGYHIVDRVVIESCFLVRDPRYLKITLDSN